MTVPAEPVTDEGKVVLQPRVVVQLPENGVVNTGQVKPPIPPHREPPGWSGDGQRPLNRQGGVRWQREDVHERGHCLSCAVTHLYLVGPGCPTTRVKPGFRSESASSGRTLSSPACVWLDLKVHFPLVLDVPILNARVYRAHCCAEGQPSPWQAHTGLRSSSPPGLMRRGGWWNLNKIERKAILPEMNIKREFLLHPNVSLCFYLTLVSFLKALHF